MTPRQTRRLIAVAVDGAAFFVAAWYLPWWAVVMIMAHGMWSFYDGATRCDLDGA